MEIDVIGVDKKIRERWMDSQTRLEKLEQECKEIDELLTDELSVSVRNDLAEKRRLLQERCNALSESLQNQHFYTMDTSDLLQAYQPPSKKISFMAKAPVAHDDVLVKQYLEILKKYNIDCPEVEETISDHHPPRKICQRCKSGDLVTNHDQTLEICENCGKQDERNYKSVSFKDISRVNLSNKYSYERRVHFKDCINQYQGKQNSSIAAAVFSDIEQQLERHGLLQGAADAPRRVRFQNVTKEHIFVFLKETGHSKHYEDVVLIYHKMTGKQVDNITHLESILMEDFDKISNLYDTRYKLTGKIDRKSFINTQYVLFQLLRRHKYPCKKEDFNMLKTLDRKSFHDDIVRDLFETLGFNFTPIF